ncbi:hypothetical protein ASG65_14060 [Bacillus sp. Leaf13]|nr:hypothetical protein ASG65_14060 [Bacillus sp. Leaf13]
MTKGIRITGRNPSKNRMYDEQTLLKFWLEYQSKRRQNIKEIKRNLNQSVPFDFSSYCKI